MKLQANSSNDVAIQKAASSNALPYARHCAKHFTYIILFKPHRNQWGDK